MKTGGGGTDFDKITCANLIQNYAFKSVSPKFTLKVSSQPLFLGQSKLKNPLKNFFKKVENAKSVRTDQGRRVTPFEPCSGLLEKNPKGNKNVKKYKCQCTNHNDPFL